MRRPTTSVSPSVLPIERVLPVVIETLQRHRNVVLQAPPGAGKTTYVPLALLDEPWLQGQKIVMLEPRRLATRAAARRMAELRGEQVGATVGYRIRRERVVGAETRIEVVTEGILTRLIQSDPTLGGIGAVIFDEFHERNLHGDLGLGLALESQELLREDLRIIVMSATLDTAAVAALLDNAPVITSEGRSYPVDIRYMPPRVTTGPIRIETSVVAAIRDAFTRETGDVLVFLPGAGEIRRVEEKLRTETLPPNVHVYPLFGNLSQSAQDEAIAPSVAGHRKIVLSTSIAETSLTIEGVRVVIDSGMMRVPRFSPGSGMTHLETVRVSRASAEQRCGRAGRLGPGVCYRLWNEHEQHQLVPHNTPEILQADLAPLALELAMAGIDDPEMLSWIDTPPVATFTQARSLLTQLGALDAQGRITPHGQAMATLAVHPRLAHMILEAEQLGHGALACDIAALLEERDILRSSGGIPDADLQLRLDVLHEHRSERNTGYHREHAGREHRLNYDVDMAAVQRVRTEARHWKQQRQSPRATSASPAATELTATELTATGLILAFAYPDRIAQRRAGGTTGRFLLRNGRGATFTTPQTLSASPYLVVAQLDGQQADSRITLAAPIDLDDIETHFAEQITNDTEITWDTTTNTVRARTIERLGAIILRERPIPHPNPEQIAAALLDGIRQLGLSALPWHDNARHVQTRIAFLRQHDPEWPDVSDDTLLATLEHWLAPHLTTMRSLGDLQHLDLAQILLNTLTWDQRRALDDRAPTTYTVPTGSHIQIDYTTPHAPILAVRLQELFGLAETPRIDRGRIPLTLHLLSPAYRPVQITQDLSGFWRTSYFDVKKDLKGRYPKHAWPDDPLTAEPTKRAKRRGE